ncbi:BNR-4 repeat-containing protein [Paenibacillus pedocola]|uniref:BNR-4 repeat-containing protein n=1 Tax=Paenibacillus pedocola TaxID=3242193 RepID=UPI002877E212|nr:BNR-4 repeat-containing protein [Paenibacillus typhae]
MNKIRTWKLSLVIMALLTLLPAATGNASAVLEEVPFPMDSSNQAGWWSPIDTYGLGFEYAYMAYNAPGSTASKHTVAIARRDNDGIWSKLPLMNGTTPAEFNDDLGHNQPSIARDGSGRFHVFASMHSNPWNYYRSDTVGGIPQNHSDELPQGMNVTYPIVTTAPNGDLYLLVRVDKDTAGKREAVLFRWNNAESVWSQIKVIASHLNRSVYPDDLVFDSNGDLHILFEWAYFAASPLRHQLSYLKYSPSTNIFTKADGTSVVPPVSLTTADIVQPLAPGEIYVQSGSDPGGPGVQSAKMTVDSDGHPYIAYRYREEGSTSFSVKQATYGTGGWTLQTVYNAAPTNAAIDVTWTGNAARIYYVKSSGSDRAFMAVNTGGAFTETSLAPGIPVERLAVDRSPKGVDILYLVDITNLKLYYGRNE